MSKVVTVAIKGKDLPGGFAIINECDFDEKQHAKMTDAELAKARKKAAEAGSESDE